MGISVKEVDDYVFKWLDRGVKGLSAMIAAAGTSADEMQRLANLAIHTFNQMIAQGRSYSEALAAMAEPLLILKLRMEALGIEGGAAIDKLLDLALVQRLHSDLFIINKSYTHKLYVHRGSILGL